MRLVPSLAAAALLAIGMVLPVGAVVIDINRSPSSAVVPNLSSHPYGGVGFVYSKESACTGTVIAPKLVLTAAHCLGKKPKKMSFYIPFEDAPAISARGKGVRYPGINKKLPPFEQLSVPDVAVIKLKKALPTWVPSYALLQAVQVPLGQAFEFVGYGMTGTGLTGGESGTATPYVKRFARNEAEQIVPGGRFFSADFDGGANLGPDPVNTGPDSTGLPANNVFGTLGTGVLEGMISFGDSGAPAFYNPAVAAAVLIARDSTLDFGPVSDVPLLMGVASYGTIFDLTQLFSSYGTSGSWAATVSVVDWIAKQGKGVTIVSGAILCLPGQICATATSNDFALPISKGCLEGYACSTLLGDLTQVAAGGSSGTPSMTTFAALTTPEGVAGVAAAGMPAGQGVAATAQVPLDDSFGFLGAALAMTAALGLRRGSRRRVRA
jgi:hypothetical protein